MFRQATTQPQRRGFEPPRTEPNGFRIHLLNRSDTVSLSVRKGAGDIAKFTATCANAAMQSLGRTILGSDIWGMPTGGGVPAVSLQMVR